jgi:hypothetical protein
MNIRYLLLTGLVLAAAAQAGDYRVLVHPQNMERLKCAMPDETYRFVKSSAPGALFFPDEAVKLSLVFKKGADQGEVKNFVLEIQQIVQRVPEPADPKLAGTDDFGPPDLVAPEGPPVRHPLKVVFDDKPELALEVSDVPIPKELGIYALVLDRGGKRQFLATLGRVPHPHPEGSIENTPILGEAQMFDDTPRYPERAAAYARMGVRGLRREGSWSERQDGTYDWNGTDPFFNACEANGIKVMYVLGGHPWHFLPFRVPTPAAGWTPKTGGYSGTGDWSAAPEMYPRYGKWITAFVQRYHKDGAGALWGLEHYNEPWEGGGISGWARDCVQYRSEMKVIADSARAASKKIKLLAASSIMNTEDKLYSDGSKEFDAYVDIITDHYVKAPMCYGPMVAKAHGKESMETESWIVNTEYRLPLGVALFMASGQLRINPWHPRALFDTVPGSKDHYLIPTPTVTATAAFNRFTTAKPFEKLIFHKHLPWVFQYGKDDDPEALLIVFGQLLSFGCGMPQERADERLWRQVDATDGGTIAIDNADGLLQFFDLAGNEIRKGEKTVTLPLTFLPAYVRCQKGPAAAAARLQAAKIEGKRPVEIVPVDFAQSVNAPDAALTVSVHNCLNRAIKGTLTVKAPDGVKLKETAQQVELAEGETKTLAFAITSAQPDPSNRYPFVFKFASDAGEAAYEETLNVAVAPKGTKTIDGKLDDWKDVPGILLVAKVEKVDATELARRPWLEMQEKQPQGMFAEVKVAWDEQNVYLSARVHDPTPETNKVRGETRNDDSYFHTAASDEISPYKEFLATQKIDGKTLKELGRSFKEVPYVYCRGPWDTAWNGDRLQVAFDVKNDWHEFAPTTDVVPYGFHAVPDTDYEYSVYQCADGKSECWRLLAPGVPRIHDFPRQPKGERTTGPVKGAKHAVVQDGNVRCYELAIPREEIPDLKLEAGSQFGFTFQIGNNSGPNIYYGEGKAATKANGLTLHPYWSVSPNCSIRWTLRE